MRTFRLAIVVLALALPLSASNYPDPVERDVVMRDVRFADGATLAEVRIHVATIGTLRHDREGHATNAVLILHGTGGTGRQFLAKNFADVLFVPGGVLDATRYFIILPDGIGHGRSSKPSDGLHAQFPQYDYHDMIDLQHRVVTEGLGVDHLLLVMGTSMGGMHTWMWGERYTRFMDGLMPLASLPAQIAGRNRVWRKMIIDAIRNDPDWNGGEYKTQPRSLDTALDLLLIAGSAPLLWQKTSPTRDEADQWLDAQKKSRLPGLDANDFLYAIEASRNYDPSHELEKIAQPLVAVNSADDFINPPELGIMERLIRQVRKGSFVLLPISPDTRGHSSHTWPVLWQQHLRELLARIEKEPKG
jgi:homoserine O-acetyltransferase